MYLCMLVVFVWIILFFQAEDGIRDLVRSRGLGDVYKRQNFNCVEKGQCEANCQGKECGSGGCGQECGYCLETVSYTHLTLPTSDLG